MSLIRNFRTGPAALSLAGLCLAGLPPAPAQAQAFDITGVWRDENAQADDKTTPSKLTLGAQPSFNDNFHGSYRSRPYLLITRQDSSKPTGPYFLYSDVGDLRAELRPVGSAGTKPLTLRLAQTSEPFRRVHATAVPIEEREYLARMLYVLPPKTLAALRVAVGDKHIYVLDPTGIEGLPLGRFFSEVATRIYVPAGLTLVPAVAPDVLKDLVQAQGEDHVFFHPEDTVPRRVPNAAFGLVTRSMIDHVAARTVHADAPERFDPPLPIMEYDELRRFPLRGVPQPPDGTGGAG